MYNSEHTYYIYMYRYISTHIHEYMYIYICRYVKICMYIQIYTNNMYENTRIQKYGITLGRLGLPVRVLIMEVSYWKPSSTRRDQATSVITWIHFKQLSKVPTCFCC